MRIKRIRVCAIDHHRNGIDGEPFHVAIFDEDKSTHPEDRGRKVAILFDEPGYCAVLDIAKLAAGDIAFGSNSWLIDSQNAPTVSHSSGGNTSTEKDFACFVAMIWLGTIQ